jgi:uncharacterized membrane protein
MKNKTMITFVFVITTLVTGLIAGLFYSYSCSVSPGLGLLPDAAYLKAMQSINRAILNPVFFISFMGTLVLLPVSAWLSYRELPSFQFWYFLAAAIIYIVAVFGVTIGGNVPLNEALDKFNIEDASTAQVVQQRLQFEAKWNMLNTIRTLGSVASLALAVLGCLARSK